MAKLPLVVALDVTAPTCDSKGMVQRVRWLLLLLAIGLAAGLACRDHGSAAGIGGQSGDEGRRVHSPWLGTGGAWSRAD